MQVFLIKNNCRRYATLSLCNILFYQAIVALRLYFRGAKYLPNDRFSATYNYTAKLVPQPQVLLALGLLKVKPRELSPPCQSTSIPTR